MTNSPATRPSLLPRSLMPGRQTMRFDVLTIPYGPHVCPVLRIINLHDVPGAMLLCNTIGPTRLTFCLGRPCTQHLHIITVHPKVHADIRRHLPMNIRRNEMFLVCFVQVVRGLLLQLGIVATRPRLVSVAPTHCTSKRPSVNPGENRAECEGTVVAPCKNRSCPRLHVSQMSWKS